MVNTHVVVNGSERTPLPGAIATARADANVTIQVTLKLRRKKELAPLTGRPVAAMTRENLGANYGASKSDISKVVEVFGKFNLSEVESNPTTRSVRLSGTIAAMEEAFQVKLFNYAHESRNYRGRVGPIHVPTEVKDIVEGVFGLDNRQSARRRRQTLRVDSPAGSASVPSDWYIPSELAAHYNFPRGDGSGQTIGLLELGGGYFSDDLKQFCGFAKIPKPPKVTTVSTDGTPTDIGRGSSDTVEVMLDVEVAAGICPKVHIVVYFAENSEQGFLTCIDAAVHDAKNDPGVLSISWSGAEESFTAQARRQFDKTLQEAALLGITVCVATGDSGSSSAISDGLAHVQFPASSPYALAVGGTTIPKKGGKEPDIVWKDSDGFSTGGGVSAVFPRPDWQKSVTIKSVNPHSIVGRCIPDISANADGNVSPYLMVADGNKQPIGGTSAASPLAAGLLTLINASRPAGDRVGYVTPVLYQASGAGKPTIGAAGFTDVQSGNNTTAPADGYRAGEGYDAASGWGTPDGVKLAALLSPPPIDLTPVIIATEHVL